MQLLTNAQNFTHSSHNFFSKNVEYSAHSTNTITQRIYIILYVLSIQFFRRTVKFLHNQCIQFFKECWKFYTFDEHHCLKNLHNFECSKYAIFWWAHTILHLQWTQFLEKCTLFLIFNMHNISTNVKKIYRFNIHNFSKNV